MNPMISHRNRQDRGADCKDLRRDIYDGYRRVGSVFNDNRTRAARPIRDDDFLWSASVIRRLRMDPIQDSAPPGNLPVITFPLLAVSGRYRGVAQVTGAVVSCRTCPGVAARRPPVRAGSAETALARRRSTGSLRRKSSRALESAIGPEGKLPVVLANLRLLFGEPIPDAVPLGGRVPVRRMEPQIASTDAANSLYLQPISPRSTIACCRG